MSDKAAKKKLIEQIMQETGYSEAKARYIAALELGEADGDYTALEADGVTPITRNRRSTLSSGEGRMPPRETQR